MQKIISNIQTSLSAYMSICLYKAHRTFLRTPAPMSRHREGGLGVGSRLMLSSLARVEGLLTVEGLIRVEGLFRVGFIRVFKLE